MDDRTKTLQVMNGVRRILGEEGLTPYREGLLFQKVHECINWRTGKQFTIREAAAELGVNYGRFRNSLMLVMPVEEASLTNEDRRRLLEAPANPTGLRKLLFGENR